MEALQNLSNTVKIAIGAAIALVVLLLVYLIAFSGPSYVTVGSTSDIDKAQAWKWKLNKMQPMMESRDGVYNLKVLDKFEDDALAAIKGNSAPEKMKKHKACVEPGALASRDARDKAAMCDLRAEIVSFLDMKGVLASSVLLRKDTADSLIGSSEELRATIQLYPDPDQKVTIDYGAMAQRVANMIGSSPDRVDISDVYGNTLWQNGKAGSGASGTSAACTPPGDPVTDIVSMEQIASACQESIIKSKIDEILGGAGRATVLASVRLSPSSETRTLNEILKGAPSEESKTDTSDSDTSDTSYDNTTSSTTTNTMAGAIDRLALSVTLDSRYVTPEQENAVREFLYGYINRDGGDPLPKVVMSSFKGKSSDKNQKDQATSPGDDLNGSGAAGEPSDADKQDAEAVAAAQSGSIPGSILAVGFMLIVGLLAVIGLLWRRGARLQAERKLFEAEFANEQQTFANWADSNPADLAADLDRLLGAPSPNRDFTNA